MRGLKRSNNRVKVAAVSAVATVLALVLTLVAGVVARPTVARADESTIGSITLQMKGSFNGVETVMKGGQIALFRVASVNRDDGPVYDVSGGQFGSSQTVSGIPSMTKQQLDEQNPNIAAALEREVSAKGVEPLQTVDITEGEARFPEVEEGLYLLVQTKLSEGDRKMTSFLLSVPDENGEYDIVGKPKPGEWTGGKDNPGDNPGDNPSDEPETPGQPATYPTPADEASKWPQPSTGELVVMFLPLAIVGFVLVWTGVHTGRRSGKAAE